VVLALWAPALVTVVGATMVAHWAPLPAPRPDAALARSLLDLRGADERGWTAFHVLYADCPCSQRLVEHLCTSARPPEVAEVVLLVGEDATTASALAHAGFRIVPTTARELRERHHIESAPLFVVTDPEGVARYSGGHTNRKQGLDHADLDALAALLAGRAESGKGERGRLHLATFEEHGEFVVEIEDDGRGIDWEAVRARAADLGLPTQSERDLVRALFAPGVSTAREVSDVSGRGIGLAAVERAATELGGRIAVRSERGRGTVLQFRFPAAVAAVTTNRLARLRAA